MGDKDSRLRYLDLFAGAGGLSEGFIREGFSPVAHVEMSKAACNTLRTRAAYHYLNTVGKSGIYCDYLSGKITREAFYSNIPSKILESIICETISARTMDSIFNKIDNLKGEGTIDLIVGGPPCQAYSLMGRARDPDGMVYDKRNYLFSFYIKFLLRYKPSFFVFENVLGLLSAKDKAGYKYFDMMQEGFEKSGYRICYKTLNAKDYGVLQNRKRVFIIGKRTNDEFEFSWPPKVTCSSTVSAIFSDLPSLKAGQGNCRKSQLSPNPDKWLIDSKIRSIDSSLPVTFHCSRNHSKRDLKIYKIAVEQWSKSHSRLRYADLPKELKTHKNQETFLDRFKVVSSSDSASQTVVAHIAKDGHYYIHPDIEQNRSLTPREVARLQSFPDDYYFESVSGKPSRTEAYKQIGNAVPVLLSQVIARSIYEAIINEH